MATIFERIRKITIGQLVDLKEEEITPSSSFVEDLGADSLDMVELVMALEEEFTTPERKVSIPDEDTEKIITVQNAMDYLRDKGVTDNELPRSAMKAMPQPTPRPANPNRPEPTKPTQAKPGLNTRPQARNGQNRAGGNRPGGQRPPQGQPHQGQSKQQQQFPKPPSGQ